MQQDPRSSAIYNYTVPAAPTWQDAADTQEWNAWADNAPADSAAVAGEDDNFGAWVDFSDPDDSLDLQTPMSSSYVSNEQIEELNVVTVRQLRRMNSLEQDASNFRTAATQTSSISLNFGVGLYNNPWDDINPTAGLSRSQARPDDDDDCDIDPDIDSALASSAWESVLVQDRNSSRSSDTDDDCEDDDDDGTYEAWTVEEHMRPNEALEAETNEFEARSNTNHVESGVLHHRHVPLEGGLEWYNTDFHEIKEARRRPTTWMQRLTGNRR